MDILAGQGNKSLGHQEIDDDWVFTLKRIPVSKRWFGFSIRVYLFLLKNYSSYDWIMIPREKKNILLILFSFFLRFGLYRNQKTRLFSYNHPFFGNKFSDGFEAKLLRFFYKWYDKTIFYTKASRDKALEKGLISQEKAGWANNTLDSHEIEKYYQFEYPDFENPAMLYIGRLIESKKIDVFFDYYHALNNKIIKSGKYLSVDIVGDGPLRSDVLKHSQENRNIRYHGTVNDQKSLSQIFRRASFVFIPGLSGLSINHAFLYGRPYVTMVSNGHGPEIDYLKHDTNGFILSGTFEENLNLLLALLTDKMKLKGMCKEAYSTGKSLSIDHWCDQVCRSLDIK